jgi:beta-glucanase (GH16 family)
MEELRRDLQVGQDEIKAKGYQYEYDKLTYDLVWSDEFDYEGLPDETKWSYDVGGHGWGNNEYQFYTEGKNAYVKDGNLIIEARKESCEGKDYTSARLVTRGKGDWLYGKIEVRAKLPLGIGSWPAIWTLPTDWAYGDWPTSGEIDIMEHVGFDLNMVHASVHTESYNHCENTQKTALKYIDGVCDEFHVYAIEWLPDKIMAYYDGELIFTFEPTIYDENPTYKEWPFDKRMYLILNNAVGGNWGAMKGFDENAFPQHMLVDYVRVYQSKGINELIKS